MKQSISLHDYTIIKFIFYVIKGYSSNNKHWTDINVEHILWHHLLQEKNYHFSMKYDKLIIHSECANYQKKWSPKNVANPQGYFLRKPAKRWW